jgi:hypothetical protein
MGFYKYQIGEERRKKMFPKLNEKTCSAVSHPGSLFRPGERVRYIKRAQIRHGEPEFYPCVVGWWDKKLGGYIVVFPEVTGEGIWLVERVTKESDLIRW